MTVGGKLSPSRNIKGLHPIAIEPEPLGRAGARPIGTATIMASSVTEARSGCSGANGAFAVRRKTAGAVTLQIVDVTILRWGG